MIFYRIVTLNKVSLSNNCENARLRQIPTYALLHYVHINRGAALPRLDIPQQTSDKMLQTRRLGKDGPEVTALGFGAMVISKAKT